MYFEEYTTSIKCRLYRNENELKYDTLKSIAHYDSISKINNKNRITIQIIYNKIRLDLS